MFKALVTLSKNTIENVCIVCPKCGNKINYFRNQGDFFSGTCPITCYDCSFSLPATNCLLNPLDLGVYHKITYHGGSAL